MLGRIALILMFMASATYARTMPIEKNDYTPYQCVFSDWDQQSCKVLSDQFPDMNIRANHCQQRFIENDPQKSVWCSVIDSETNEIYNEYADCLIDTGFLDKTKRHCRLACEGDPYQMGCDKSFWLNETLNGISGLFNVDEHMIKPSNVKSYIGDVNFDINGLFRIPVHTDMIKIVGENLRNKFSGIGGCIEFTVYTYGETGESIDSIYIPQSTTCIGVINVWSPSVSFNFTIETGVLDNVTFIGFGLTNDPGYFQALREVAMDKLTMTFIR